MNETQDSITIQLPAKTERPLRMGAAAAGMTMTEFARGLFFAGMLSKRELIRSTQKIEKAEQKKTSDVTPDPKRAA